MYSVMVELTLKYQTGLGRQPLPVDNAVMLAAIVAVAVTAHSIDTVAVVVLAHIERERLVDGSTF